MKFCNCILVSISIYIIILLTTELSWAQQSEIQQAQYVDSLTNAGDEALSNEHYEEAIRIHQEALTLNKLLGRHTQAADNYNYIGIAYHYLGLTDSAIAYCVSGLSIAKSVDDQQIIAECFNNLGLIYESISQYQTALMYHDSALIIHKSIGDKDGISCSYNNIASVYDWFCKYDVALAYHDSSLKIDKEIKDQKGQSVSYNNIGNTYQTIGQYEKALSYYDSSLYIARNLGDRLSVGITLTNIGNLYHSLNQYDKALSYYDSVIAIGRAKGAEIQYRYGESIVLHRVGQAYHGLKNYERALAYFDTSLAIKKEIGDIYGQASVLSSIGNVYFATNDYDQALSMYNTALLIMRDVSMVQGECAVLAHIAEVYTATDQYEAALQYLDSSFTKAEEANDIVMQGKILAGFGHVYEEQDDIEQAIGFYKQAIEYKEKIRDWMIQGDLRTFYIEKEDELYQRIAILLIMLERYEEAFDYLERSHSEKLRQSFEEGESAAFDPSLNRVLERINFIEAEIDGLRKLIEHGDIDERDYQEKIDSLSGTLNGKLTDLKYHHPRLYNTLIPQRRTLKCIQEIIPEETMFIEFLAYNDKYVAFLFTKNMFLAKVLRANREKIDNMVVESMHMVTSLNDREELNKHYELLYDILLYPLQNCFLPYNNLVIIPYGALHYLPFHCLRTKDQEGENQYLLQSHCVSYLPSASFLFDLADEQEMATEELLAFGNCDGTLPSAAAEVDSIAGLFARVLVFKGNDASKDHFKEYCDSYRYIHFATHGVLRSDPRFSQIIMSPHTGNLTVREILGLSGKLQQTSLVTLSACETAVEVNPDTAGVELITLSNAFKVAGVPSTIATLWSIADRSTSLLMYDFYDNLKNQKCHKLEALRQAQIKMLKSNDYSHPFFWAPFILIGDWK